MLLRTVVGVVTADISIMHRAILLSLITIAYREQQLQMNTYMMHGPHVVMCVRCVLYRVIYRCYSVSLSILPHSIIINLCLRYHIIKSNSPCKGIWYNKRVYERKFFMHSFVHLQTFNVEFGLWKLMSSYDNWDFNRLCVCFCFDFRIWKYRWNGKKICISMNSTLCNYRTHFGGNCDTILDFQCIFSLSCNFVCHQI